MLPVILLGGLELVRALGMAKIPVILASSERRTPSMASRYCAGVIELPPFAQREAVVEALIRASPRGAPLFYDNDDRLALVQDYRAALAPHFALLLNPPELGEALLDKSRFQALAERRGLPVPRRIDWEALDAASGPVLVKPKTRTAWEDSSVLRHLFGGGGFQPEPEVMQAEMTIDFRDAILGTTMALTVNGESIPRDDITFVVKTLLAPGEDIGWAGIGMKSAASSLDSATGIFVLEALERVNAELGTATAIITHNAGIRKIAITGSGSPVSSVMVMIFRALALSISMTR